MRFSILLSAAALIASPAFAADMNSYRPGNAYHSSIVPSVASCESQCSGDAQCRAWNYVKAAPAAPGVCEFMSSASTPVASQVSISGVSAAHGYQSPRLVAGGTNTVRVGNIEPPKPAPTVQMQSPTRRVVRQPVPGQIPVQGASIQRQMVPPQRVQPRTFRPALDGMMRTVPQQGRAPVVSRGRARSGPNARATYPNRNLNAGRPPIGQDIPAPVQMQTQPQAPRTVERPVVPAQPQIPVSAAAMPRSPASNPVSWDSIRVKPPVLMPQATRAQTQLPAPASNSGLYGSLHDDVGGQPPMQTSPSRPTEPVYAEQLAGAMPR